ncbi:MAG: virulence factor [Acidobacteria bacterium]|nr:virulence factor [Acidobacteriota bacterium]
MTSEYQIIYWRDIPAQVKVRAGARRVARGLSDRFQQAIDEAAMRAGLAGTDQYLAAWRMSPWQQRDGEPESIAEGVVSVVEADYPPSRLMEMVLNGGCDPPTQSVS